MFQWSKAKLRRLAKLTGKQGPLEWMLVVREIHPQFGLPVVPAMGPTLAALIMMIESGGSAFVG